MAMDVIDYRIEGHDMQYVEVDLDPGEAMVGEAGSLMFMEDGVSLETIFGDGSSSSGRTSGLFGKLVGAGKRLLTGESLFTTVYQNQSNQIRKLGFAAPYPGKILAMDLSKLGGQLICQRDGFLCAARGVSLGIAFQQKLGVGFFGGEGFIMQKLEGDGLAFVHAGGTVMRRDLQAGELLRVDTGCLVALAGGTAFDIEYVGKIKTALFGGEGLFFAVVRGPGTVWLQSLPFSRLASRIFAAAPQTGGGGREQGGLLGLGALGGGLSGVFGGDSDEETARPRNQRARPGRDAGSERAPLRVRAGCLPTPRAPRRSCSSSRRTQERHRPRRFLQGGPAGQAVPFRSSSA
jgi:uncharacterized protein (AIM24 family)